MHYLKNINNPSDLKQLTPVELPALAEEIRHFMIESLSKTGGHLGASLGTVELTLALHYIFNMPKDKIVWDVGHQAYTHKVITGRRESFGTIRQYNGISGFLKRAESEYDVFGAGHAATSISAALGIAKVFQQRGQQERAIAVIGDGAMTSGIAFEALNNAGNSASNLIVILNDNEMSIDPNVGALCKFFTSHLNSKGFSELREFIKKTVKQVPKIGDQLFKICRRAAETTAGFFTPGFMFEAFGFHYIGPIDGHDINEMLQIFKMVQSTPISDKPVLIHVLTTKGKGCGFAEADKPKYHGLGPYDMQTGATKKSSAVTYSQVATDAIIDLAKLDKRVVGITAAMPSGTGLTKLMKEVPQQYVDVGIAEGHAVTFAAGMATEGFKPICAIYSTFLQRAYDSIVHDVCLQKLPVLFALDRGGFAGDDGPTHHGLFDFSYLRHIPNMVVMAPRDENMLRQMLYTGYTLNNPAAVRYPRGVGVGVVPQKEFTAIPVGKGEILVDTEADTADVAILAAGSCVHPSIEAAKRLAEEGINAIVVDMRFVKPLDGDLLRELAGRVKKFVTAEENVVAGGFGSAISEWLAANNIYDIAVKMIGVGDYFVDHGTQDILKAREGLDADGIANSTRLFVQNEIDDTKVDDHHRIEDEKNISHQKSS